jgi:hypothetical protein
MATKSYAGRAAAGGALVAVLLVGSLQAQAGSGTTAPTSAVAAQALAQSVRIPAGVRANGQPLPSGVYTLRVSGDPVAPVVGQGPDSARWVEFVQGGQVRGKELASVVAPADVKAVAKRTPPTEGRGIVHVLRGAEYIRVWVNNSGTQYLVHLTASAAR